MINQITMLIEIIKCVYIRHEQPIYLFVKYNKSHTNFPIGIHAQHSLVLVWKWVPVLWNNNDGDGKLIA